MTTRLLTLDQVGRRLGLAAPTIRKLIATGHLPIVTPSPGRRSRRVREQDLLAFIQSRLSQLEGNVSAKVSGW